MKIDVAGLSLEAARDFLVSAVVPRPIAWVSSVSAEGVYNLAPFSFFTPLCSDPLLVGFSINLKSSGQKKDTLRNIEANGEYVISIVSEELASAMLKTSAGYPPEVSEFQRAGLTPVPAQTVRVPLVGEAPVNLGCRRHRILEFGRGTKAYFVIGEIVEAHVKDELWVNGQLDHAGLKAIARMGGQRFCRTRDTFELKWPKF